MLSIIRSPPIDRSFPRKTRQLLSIVMVAKRILLSDIFLSPFFCPDFLFLNLPFLFFVCDNCRKYKPLYIRDLSLMCQPSSTVGDGWMICPSSEVRILFVITCD